MTLAVSAATFNVQTATCCTNKVNCYGYTNPLVDPSGATCLAGGTMTCVCEAYYDNETYPTSVAGCTYSSSNPTVATIDA